MISMVDMKTKSATRPANAGHTDGRLAADSTPPHVKTREVAPKEKYAPKSDAAFPSVSRLVIGAVHFAVLLGIVGLLVAYAMSALSTNKRMAVVKVVAPQMQLILAPYDGQFEGTPLPKGAPVHEGQVLGVVKTREVRDELESASHRWENLQREILVTSQAASTSASQAPHDRVRELRLEANALEARIAQLKELQKDLVVRSPVDGRIWFGLSGSKAVEKNEEVTQVWPTGTDLRIEIEAPRRYIDEIVMDGSVTCYFATPEGEVVVTATPIPSTRQMLLAENKENRSDKQVFGRIECVPEANASQTLLPGWIGTL